MYMTLNFTFMKWLPSLHKYICMLYSRPWSLRSSTLHIHHIWKHCVRACVRARVHEYFSLCFVLVHAHRHTYHLPCMTSEQLELRYLMRHALSLHISVHVCMYIYMCVYIYIYIYICICICIYMLRYFSSFEASEPSRCPWCMAFDMFVFMHTQCVYFY